MKGTWKIAAWALAFGLGLGRWAGAVTTTDSLTVTVRPNAYYAVDITTSATTTLDLGTVDLAGTTQTVKPATVTVQSTFATTDLTLDGDINASASAWSFDTNTGAQETDSLQAWAVFTSVDHSSAPTKNTAYFNGTTTSAGADSDLIDGTAQGVGDAALGNFEDGNFDMDSLGPNVTRHLWMYFKLPSASTAGSSNAQNITITLGAEATN